MSLARMSRRDRALIAGVAVALLYGVAAMMFVMKFRPQWRSAEKNYRTKVEELAKQKALIAETPAWIERAEQTRLQMPEVEEDESTQVRWQTIHDSLVKKYHLTTPRESMRPEVEQGDVWEMPLDATFEASLVRLVEFIHALGEVEGAQFDVSELDISPKSNGYLSGRYTLTCAYMKKGSSK